MAELITIETPDSDQRLDRWLKSAYPALTQSILQKWLRKGEVRVNGKRAEANHRLNANDQVRLPPQANEFKTVPDKKPVRPLGQTEKLTMEKIVLFEDKDILAIDKPAGLAVQGGTKTTTHLDHWLTHLTDKDGEKPRLVHRLDKETSGIMVLAKNRKVAADLGMQFRTRKIEKTYIAMLLGVPEIHEGRVTAPLSKLPSYRGEQMKIDEEDGKDAETDYDVIDYAGKAASLVVLRPRTGRTHQLRVHMALLDTPIIGDRKYGNGKEQDLPNFLFLHAYKLVVPGKKVLTAALPHHFKLAAEHYGFDLSLLKSV